MRFDGLDPREVTKIDKLRLNSVRKAIFKSCQDLGKGESNPVAYDTSWVARIGGNHSSGPAFPECLRWLRQHQNQDGSWGDRHCTSSFVLNTLSAVIALRQWNMPGDSEIIARGLLALRNHRSVNVRCVKFSVLVANLINDAHELNLSIPTWLEKYLIEGNEQLKNLEPGLMTNIPNESWSFLEVAGRFELDLENYRPEIVRAGLIFGQPAPTAFILQYARQRGENILEAEWSLQRLVEKNGGGMPHVVEWGTLEFAIGLHILLAAGLDPRKNDKHGAVKEIIRKFENCSKKSSKYPSLWSVFEEHHACTANFLSVNENDTIDDEFLRDNKRSQDTLIHTSDANSYTSNRADTFFEANIQPPIAQSIQRRSFECQGNKCARWNPLVENFSLTHALHRLITCHFSSNFYEPIDKGLIIDQFLRDQNEDGGWGGDESKSSLEETAFACLILYVIHRRKYNILSAINLTKLSKLINKDETLTENFWRWKVSFHIPALSNLLLNVAKYAVYHMQRLSAWSKILKENTLHVTELRITDASGADVYFGNIFRLQPAIVTAEYLDVEKREIHRIITSDILGRKIRVGCDSKIKAQDGQYGLMDNKLILHDTPVSCFDVDDKENIESSDRRCDSDKAKYSTYLSRLIECSTSLSFSMHPSRLPVFDRASEITSLVMMFTLDDIIDTYLLGKSHLSSALKDMLDITLNTLKGNTHPPKLPPFHFPAYNDFMRCVLNELRVISQNGWDANNYIKEFDRLLWQTVPPSHRDTYRNIIPTVKRYLQIEKITTTFSYYLERSCQTEGISMNNFRGLPAFKRYISCAEKAHRILVDIPSILNDTATLDNYCLRVQHEFKLTIGEAVARAARKANKEMTKMQVLKKTLREDSGLSEQHDLEHCFWLAECFIDGGFAWAMNTQRYKSEWTCYNADVKLDSSIENVLQDILV